MITLEQCRNAVDLQMTDEQLLVLRDMIYETCYSFLTVLKK